MRQPRPSLRFGPRWVAAHRITTNPEEIQELGRACFACDSAIERTWLQVSELAPMQESLQPRGQHWIRPCLSMPWRPMPSGRPSRSTVPASYCRQVVCYAMDFEDRPEIPGARVARARPQAESLFRLR